MRVKEKGKSSKSQLQVNVTITITLPDIFTIGCAKNLARKSKRATGIERWEKSMSLKSDRIRSASQLK